MHEFKLPSSLTISNCAEILGSVIEAKNSNGKIELDSSDVETVDTAGIQLICSFCKDGGNVTHTNMSDKVKQNMMILGLLPA